MKTTINVESLLDLKAATNHPCWQVALPAYLGMRCRVKGKTLSNLITHYHDQLICTPRTYILALLCEA